VHPRSIHDETRTGGRAVEVTETRRVNRSNSAGVRKRRCAKFDRTLTCTRALSRATLDIMSYARETLGQVFRNEYGLIVSSLIRRSGSFDLAEESLQEAFTTAVVTWERDGVPQNPGAWLTTVAHRKLIDAVRREKTRTDKQPELEFEAGRLLERTESAPLNDALEYPDDRLRLIFTCCHPTLSQESQIALTLRTLGGLTTIEIARAFLLPEPTLAQRLVRAKNKIRLARIPYQVPSVEVLPERLAAVRTVVYLIFNEGYTATSGDCLTRNDLCKEAIRLGRVLCELLPNDAENLGLLALMLLQNSRRDTRISKHRELVTLDEQDRSLWDRAVIEEGLRLVETALRLHNVGAYQLQAAIAAVHSEATSAAETDWRQITALYRELKRINPSPIVALNHSVAVAMSEGIEHGLELIDEAGATGKLDKYYAFHASRADLLRRLGRHTEAREAYKRAETLTDNFVEQKYLRRRISELNADE
jgi:RNA polymerase sigma-70 factor, ECF subfamily